MPAALVQVLEELAREKYCKGQACCGGQAHWIALRLREALEQAEVMPDGAGAS